MKPRRRLTLDYASTPDTASDKQMRFYTTEQLGPKQSMTPEGFLLCEDVPLARPGEMIYGPEETPIEPDSSGVVRITRTIEELYRPETIASFNGKSVTNEHPEEDVVPANWKKYEVGVLINVRKGTGDNEGLLVGDFLIKDKDTINDIRNDKREVSLGYDAGYKKTAEGRGIQTAILGNHVALVDRGRCGPRCAIQDHDSTNLEKENDMATATVKGLPTRRRLSQETVRRVLDKAMLEMEKMDGGEQQELSKDEAGEYGTDLTGSGMQHIHIHLNGTTAPDGKTGSIGGDGNGKGGAATEDDFPSGPEFPENKNAGNDPQRMTGQDDPNEMRFQKIEMTLAAILKALGAGGEQQQAQPGAAAPAADPTAQPDDQMRDEEAEEMAEEVNDAEGRFGEERMTKDQAKKVRDSQPLEVSYQALVSDSEILVPGMRIPTYDSAAHPVDTLYGMCNYRKKALDLAYMTNEGKVAIDQALRGRTFDTSVMDCKCIRKTFDAAVAVRRSMNNGPAHATVDHNNVVQGNFYQSPNAFQRVGPVRDVQDLNSLYKEHYKRG